MTSEKLRQLDERIRAMSLRERLFIFAAVAAVVYALVQTLLVDPNQLRARQANDRLQAAQATLAEIETSRASQAGQRTLDPDQAQRDALAGLESRLRELNAELETRERTLIPPDRMQQVLKEMVRGQGGLRIVGFKTLAPQPVALQQAAEGAPPGFYRHGFEITVSGGYAELVAYLERLEALPWKLDWAEASLDAASRPDLKLTLTLYTLSLEEAWLRV